MDEEDGQLFPTMEDTAESNPNPVQSLALSEPSRPPQPASPQAPPLQAAPSTAQNQVEKQRRQPLPTPMSLESRQLSIAAAEPSQQVANAAQSRLSARQVRKQARGEKHSHQLQRASSV